MERREKGCGALTEGPDALLQQLLLAAAALAESAQGHGCHDLADFPGAGAGFVAAGLAGPAPTPCLPWAFLVGFSVDTTRREPWSRALKCCTIEAKLGSFLNL